MHRSAEFVFVMVIAAVSIAALVYFVFFLTFGTALTASSTPTGAVTGSGNSNGGWFVPFLGGFILLFICSTAIYHYWHHKD